MPSHWTEAGGVSIRHDQDGGQMGHGNTAGVGGIAYTTELV